MEIKFTQISKEDLKDNFFLIKLGSEDRPATEEDMNDFSNNLGTIIDLMKLDFKPLFFISHHCVNISQWSNDDLIEARDKFDNRIKELKGEEKKIESVETLKYIKKEWELYKQTLTEKYPVEENKEWEFTCEHHKKINKIIEEIEG